jgi:hypothetical protein
MPGNARAWDLWSGTCCHPPEFEIDTINKGKIHAKEIQCRDMLPAFDKQAIVLETYSYKYLGYIYEITGVDNNTILVTHDHPIMTLHEPSNRYDWKMAKFVNHDDYMVREFEMLVRVKQITKHRYCNTVIGFKTDLGWYSIPYKVHNCCHPPNPCIGMAGPIITYSSDTYCNNLGQARHFDITLGFCGHTGMIVTSSPDTYCNNRGIARQGDAVAGCNIGSIVTASGDTFTNG